MSKKSTAYSILALCFTTYLTAYMLRVNYSSALPAISQQMSLSESQLGVAGAAFFITYAVGQLMNGFISDAISPFKFVVFALAGTVVLNLTVSFSDSFGTILLFWACNGYFQSIFWGCLQRILSFYFDKEKHSMVATTMSASMACGFIVTWAVLGRILHGASWKSYFFVPAVWGAVMLLVWALVLWRTRNMEIERHEISFDTLKHSLHFIVEKRLYVICGICMCMSFVKESISVWGPTIIADMLRVDVDSSSLVLFIIPVGNLCGMFLAKYLIDRFHGNELKTLGVMFAAIAGGAVLLFIFKESVLPVTIIMLVEISALSFGCNSILLSFIPLAYAKYNLVSTLVGIFDFSSYIGAAASSLIVGAVLSGGSWTRITLLWIVLINLALLFCFVAKKKTKLL